MFSLLPRQADSAREVLGSKLQSALHEEMGLLERVQQLEAVKSTLEAKVAALQEGQGEGVQRLSAQLTAGESERDELQKTVLQQRAENEKVYDTKTLGFLELAPCHRRNSSYTTYDLGLPVYWPK